MLRRILFVLEAIWSSVLKQKLQRFVQNPHKCAEWGSEIIKYDKEYVCFLHPTIRIQLHRTIAQTNGFVGEMKGLQAAFPKVCGPDAFWTTFVKQEM